MKKEYKRILLLKVPHCVHPDAAAKDTSFRQRHTFRPVPSFALASLSAFLDKFGIYGYECEAVDINIEAYRKPGVPINIDEYPFLLKRAIESRDYDVLAVSTMFVFNARWLKMAVDLSRRHRPEAKIIAGGGYPTVFPKECLENHAIDSVVIGEGEATLVHLLNELNHFSDRDFEDKFPFDGYGIKSDLGDIEIVPKKSFLDMEDIPISAWDRLDVQKYFENSGQCTLPIEAVRGCPYHCTFCNTQLTWGYRLRYKNVDGLIKEMKELMSRYGAQLHFIDDNRSVDRSWMAEFLNSIIREQIVLEAAPSSFHANHLDDELLELLKKAGVKTIGIGVETGSQELQKRIKKNLDLERVTKIVRMIKSKGLRVHANYMVGFPHESMDQIEETLEFAKALKAHSNQFLVLVPYPGTELFEQAKKDQLLTIDESSLDSFEPRKANFLFSTEWTFERLSELIYDRNIDLNFLNNPDLEDGEYRDSFRGFLEDLLVRIPGHVIALIVLGHIYKKEKKIEKAEQFFLEAVKNLGTDNINETFHKYLFWPHPIIEEFNAYCEANGIQIGRVENIGHS